MRRLLTLFAVLITFAACSEDPTNEPTPPTPPEPEPGLERPLPVEPNVRRMLWASINSSKEVVKSTLYEFNDKVLVSWRLFPSDDKELGFDLYRLSNGTETKLNNEPIVGRTNFQDLTANLGMDNIYRLCYAGSNETLDIHTLPATQASAGLPYRSVMLQSTADVEQGVFYTPNDGAIGDLDGDGVPEIILKRQFRLEQFVETKICPKEYRHSTLYEAYKLDGSFMWRIESGPNIPLGNSSSFAVCDFDGDGKCEIALRTAEGTIFGDGTEIGDTNNDGTTDYRVDGDDNIHGGPEFLSVLDGVTGRELARTDYIALGKSADWGDLNYYRSSSYRVGAGSFDGIHNSILICRGCYNKIVLEAWDYYGGKLSRKWRFDTTDGIHGEYAGQGYHNLRVGDVDNDGFDEVVYGSCTIDHNGKGLNCCGYGHGDALHLGDFDPDIAGLEIYSCFEFGDIGAALRSARTGALIWRYDSTEDVGRALISDIDSSSRGCEAWWFRGNVHSIKQDDLGYEAGSCNFAIWWSGKLTREILNGTTIDGIDPSTKKGIRYFTLYKYGATSINGTKENPVLVADFLGDWREEIILPTQNLDELRIFSTWYPSEYQFPYLLSDHLYNMCVVTQNIGYNQPNFVSYYLASDM